MSDVGLHNAASSGVSAQPDAELHAALGRRSIVLVGMMGAGKSSIGRRLAARLGIPFVDADTEIEKAAGMTIPEIFAAHGEPYFRAGEQRVIARLLDAGPQVLATGGGAFMNAETRAAIAAKGISVWLRATLDVLTRRIKRRGDRPLLKNTNPIDTLRRLIDERYPVYAEAALTVESRDVPHETIVEEIVSGLRGYVSFNPAGECDMTVPVRPTDPIKVNVGLDERAYDVVIGRGLLATLGPNLAAMRPGAKAAIVTDATVAGHHLTATEAILKSAGIPSVKIVVPAGEKTKSFRFLEQVCDELIGGRIERGDLVIALGGGVVGDLAGFAASVVRRGVDYVQVPTTLLAQVDSSVGGKTAINSGKGKNLIGAFYQPIHVVADTALLDTLPKRDFRAGYAEVVKYGLLGDREFFEWLEANWQEVFTGGPARGNLPAPREYAVLKSVQAKADIVARDEHEHGDRMLLNLGHTFGHAFEAAAGYSDRLLHGEAVALGMSLAFEFSARKGLIPQADADRVIKHLATVGLPTHVNDIPGEWPNVDAMMDLIAQDKKVKRGQLTFILVRGIGQAFVTRDVDAADIRAFLAEKLAQR